MSIHYTLFNIHYTDKPNPKPYTTTSIIYNNKIWMTQKLKLQKNHKRERYRRKQAERHWSQLYVTLAKLHKLVKENSALPSQRPQRKYFWLVNCLQIQLWLSLTHKYSSSASTGSLYGHGFYKIFKWLIKLHLVTNTQAPRVTRFTSYPNRSPNFHWIRVRVQLCTIFGATFFFFFWLSSHLSLLL